MKYLKCSIAVISFITLIGVHAAQRGIQRDESWQGFYFGLSSGAGQGNAHTSFTEHTYINLTQEDVAGIIQTITKSQNSGNLSGNITGSPVSLLVGYNIHLVSYPRFIFGGQIEG